MALLSIATFAAVAASQVSFTKRYPAIDSRADLERYRSAVSLWMWGTLVVMAICLALPLAILVPVFVSPGPVEPNWWPIAVVWIPALLRSQISAIETRCRNLRVSTALAAEYDAISKVWVSKALPRFTTVPETASEAYAGASEANQQRLLDDTYDLDVELFRDSCVLMSIGIGELMYGALSLAGAPVSTPFAWTMAGLGLATFVGSTLLSWRLEIGYRISMVCAALQLPLLPMGTGFGIWTLTSMQRAKAAVSAEYLEALRRSPTEVKRPHIRFLLLGLLVLHLFGGNLMLIDLALFFATKP